MARRAAVLHFPSEIVDKPLVSRLIKRFDVEVNIVEAHINPNEDGMMMVFIEGERGEIEEAIRSLRKDGVKVALPEQGIYLDETRCVHCGACTAHCVTRALWLDRESMRLNFDYKKCIACQLCITVCPYKALRSSILEG